MPTINVSANSTAELQEIADILAKSRKVVVVTGAGISTNVGIPDFRSEHGLYSMIQAQYDAALENPPWEINDYDIDDRPKKKRRVTERYYYELVTADGVRVESPVEESSELPDEQSSGQATEQSTQQSSKEVSAQPEAPPPTSSRRTSRRHGPLAQDNVKNEFRKPSLKDETILSRDAPLAQDTPTNKAPILPPKTQNKSRARKSISAQDNTVTESSKSRSKSQTAQNRRAPLTQGNTIRKSSILPPKNEITLARNAPSTQDNPKTPSSKSSVKGALSRVRVIRACDRCRTRKIKCGELRPCCEACTKAKVECITTTTTGNPNPRGRVSHNGEIESREDITPAMEMELDSESFNTEEKASQQLLQESNEYSSQYSSQYSSEDSNKLIENVDSIDNNNKKQARRSLRTNSSSLSFTSEESSIASKIISNSSRSNSLRRESSLRSTIQASLSNQKSSLSNTSTSTSTSTSTPIPTPIPRNFKRSSSLIPSAVNSIIENASSSSRQSKRSRADSLPPQFTKQSSSLRRSSRRSTPTFELPGSKLSSTINVESASTSSSATPSITSSECGSSNKRSFLSEASSITTASESEEPLSQSSQSSSSRILPNLKGKDLFDSVIWSDPFSTSIFYMFISNFRRRINNDVKSTTTTHQFIRALRDNGRLVRNYTQNIDCLEEREGLTTDLELGAGDRTRFQTKVQGKSLPTGGEERGGKDSSVGTGVECVLLHGSLRKLRCGVCSKLTSWDEEDRESTTMAGSAPDCPSCISSSISRQDKGRRGLAVGRLRPDIVLYGEEHPHANLVGPLIIHDLKLGPDVLLILGTSLRVHGLKIMVKEFAQAVHARGGSVIFVNQTKPPESQWGDVIDYWVEWDCDAWVLDLKKRRSDIWLPYSNATQNVTTKDKEPAPSKQREPGAKIPPYRPQCKRDDKTNAVHFTFKILDDLRKLKDKEGNVSERQIYWQPFDRRPFRASTGQIVEHESSKKERPNVLPIRKGRKSLPAPAHVKPPSSAATTKPQRRKTISDNSNTTAVNTNTTTPSTDPSGHRSGAWLGNFLLKEARRFAPNIPESLFEDFKSRVPFERLANNVPGNSIGYKRSFGEAGVEGGGEGTGLPNLRGLLDSSISIQGMSLSSLSPTGWTGNGKGVDGRRGSEVVENGNGDGDGNNEVVMREKGKEIPMAKHSYGTRSKRSSRIGGEGFVDAGEIVNADGRNGEGSGSSNASMSADDTIVVSPTGRDRMSIGAVCNDR